MPRIKGKERKGCRECTAVRERKREARRRGSEVRGYSMRTVFGLLDGQTLSIVITEVREERTGSY